MIDDMAVYIAILGKYNEGYLVGAWFTFPIDEEDVKEKIGLNEQYEEYAIHDTDNFPIAIGEYVSIEELNEMLLLVGIGIALYFNQEIFIIQRGLGITSVLFVILIIPELWKNKSNQCMEIENTSYYSLRQIYSTRIFLFGLVDVILLTAFCIFLHGSLHITLLSLLSQFVFPAVVTACICFGLLCNKKNVNETISIVLCILWSVVWWLITANEKIYSVIKMPVWILLLGIALLILGSMIYRVLHDCTRYWEGHSNGFNDN